VTATTTFTALHRALHRVADRFRTGVFHARVALAVHEAGPHGARVADLGHDLAAIPDELDRALTDLHGDGLARLKTAHADSSDDVRVVLTDRGRMLARQVLAQAHAHHPSRAHREIVAPLERARTIADLPRAAGDPTGFWPGARV
jgi:DNA-binding MarR family transcriptional regulator